jgi:hypothetical protein
MQAAGAYHGPVLILDQHTAEPIGFPVHAAAGTGPVRIEIVLGQDNHFSHTDQNHGEYSDDGKSSFQHELLLS